MTEHFEDAADDEADWALARGGDGRAAGRVFDRHHDRVRRHAFRLVPVAADADDIVAIVFLEAWRRREVVRFVAGSLLPWLLVTATNASRNVSRSARRHRALLDRLPPPDPAPDLADGYDDEHRQLSERLRSMTVRDRQVVVLCTLYGYSSSDAASALGVPVGTVKSRLSRALRRLAVAPTPDHASPSDSRSRGDASSSDHPPPRLIRPTEGPAHEHS